MSDRKAVIKNADMSEEMQQDAVDCATQVWSAVDTGYKNGEPPPKSPSSPYSLLPMMFKCPIQISGTWKI